MAQKRVKIDHLSTCFAKFFSMKTMFLEIFLDVLTTRGHAWQCFCGVGVVSAIICGQYESQDCYCEVCAPSSSFPCFISVVNVSRMSDHERGPEDDEKETKSAAKRPKFDQTESQVWPGHVYVSEFGRKENDVPEVPPELDIGRVRGASANSTLATCTNTSKS